MRFNLIGWLGLYRWRTRGVVGAVRPLVTFSVDTVHRPDVTLALETSRGQDAIELVIEIANTTADEDLGPKRDLYRKFGVQEYIVWRVGDRALDWFELRDRYYWPLDPGSDGIIRSKVFPGLWLDPVALLASDAARVLAVAQLGHGSSEHTAFLQELARRAANPA